MNRWSFKKLFSDLKIRVEEEGKKDSSWLMGYVQGLGNRKLTGYQFGALVDLLLVHPDEPEASPAPAVPVAASAPAVKYPDQVKAAVGAAIKRP